MPQIIWGPEFEIGHPTIDAEHQRLTEITNALSLAVEEGRGQETVAAALEALTDYTSYHFESEEALMVAAKYPNLRAHQAEHAEFIGRVGNFGLDDLIGMTDVSAPLIAFLGDWLVDHILGSDKRVVAHLNASATG